MSDFTPHEAPAREAHQLPVMLSHKLVGRESALAQVYGQLKEGNAVLVHGQPGVGKTALAATLGSAYAQQPGGTLWFNVESPRLEELLVRVGRAYTVPEITNTETPLGMIGAVENTLRKNKPFIVLDGKLDADVATRFVTRCVTGLPTLLLNEQKLDGPWAALELAPLEAQQAALLFKQEARQTSSEHDGDVDRIVSLTGFLPFGIVLAARAMLASKQTPDAYLKLLQQVAEAAGGSKAVAALTASFRALTGPLQGVLLMMGATFDGRASAELLSAISSAPLESVQQAMNIMAGLNLVERTQRKGAAYYRLHSITHAFAQTWLHGSNRLEGLQDRVRDAVLAYAKKYGAQGAEGYTKLAMEMDSFLATARWAAEKGQRSVAAELVAALSQGDFVNRCGYLYELLLLRGLASTSTSAFPAYGSEPAGVLPADEFEEDFAEEEELEGDEIFDDDLFVDDEDEEVEDENEDEALEPLANRLFTGLADEQEAFDTGELRAVRPEALIDLTSGDIQKLRSALVLARQSGDKSRQIQALKAIAEQEVRQGMENEAIAMYGEALDLMEGQEASPDLLDTLKTLSALMVKTENYQAAVMHATRGIKLAEQLGDTSAKLALLVTLGDARQQLGESDAAGKDYAAALLLARANGDKENEGIILLKQGYSHLDSGDSDMAVYTWEQALAQFREQGKRAYEGKALGALGTAYADQDRWSEAISFHTSALHIAREVGDKDEETQQLSSLGYAAVQANQLGQALLRYRQALHLAFEKDDSSTVVSIIIDICRLLVESRKHVAIAELLIDEALEHEPNDKDVRQLKERIESELKLAEAYQIELLPAAGTAQDYASNAYALLDN